MTGLDVAVAPAVDLASAIRTKELSSVELLDAYLDRIERLDGAINAVVTLDIDRARIACTAADKATLTDAELGPLHGLPVTIKDAIAVEGVRSTGGATELADHVPTADAPAVARLKAAGAIVFGKTNVPRWSADVQTTNELFGTTNNPWDLDCTPGGSSGGAAAAVACGFTAFELGTDIGGSIRFPAHFCGVFGLKPTYGIVPQDGYLSHVGGGTVDVDINVFGPITRSAPDLDLVLGVLTDRGTDPRDGWYLELPLSPLKGVEGLRVATWFDEPGFPVEQGYRAVLGSLADRLADGGAHVGPAHPPAGMGEQFELFVDLLGAAMSPSAPPGSASTLPHRRWLELVERRAALRAEWADWFEHWHCLLCPVAPTAAIPHDASMPASSRMIDVGGLARPYLEIAAWTGVVGNMGLPAAVAPIGSTPTGLPVGVQVVTPSFRDRRAIQIAATISRLSGGGYMSPGDVPQAGDQAGGPLRSHS
jgi:amidase